MIIKNCEIWYAKLDPKRPAKKFNPKAPTWEVQIRTKDKTVKKAWDEMKLNVKPVMSPDETSVLYWRVNLKKKSVKDDGTATAPVQVVDGKGGDLDPNTIGNESIANIRVFQYDYVYEGKKGIASMLMGVQVVRHKVYTPKGIEDFDEAEYERIEPEPELEGDGDKVF